jgi:uncharacterized coiled-coil DUF342 family protein
MTEEKKQWLAPAVIIAIVVAGAGYLGSYGGKRQSEGEDKQELLQLRQEVDRIRDQRYITREEFNGLNSRIDELNNRISEWRKKRDESDQRTLEMLKNISADVNKKY